MRRLLVGFMALTVAGCGKEVRTLAADQPQTAPTGADDPRVTQYQGNAYQIAQGGRYFTWYGCGACHAAGARGARDLGDHRWRHGEGVDRVYSYIARGHVVAAQEGGTPYGERIPAEQLWQITAYVRDLPNIDQGKRRRQDADQSGEPQGGFWPGAVR